MSKMTNCKACEKEIAKGVNKCVHCGKDQRNFFMKHKVLTGILAVFILGGIASATGGKKDSNESNSVATSKDSTVVVSNVVAVKPEVTITSADLAKAYSDNEVKADKSYKDKFANITGQIDDIGVMFGSTYITLSDGKEMSITSVQCFIEDKAEIEKVSNLNKGDKITIEGTIDGKSLNVSVKKCKIK